MGIFEVVARIEVAALVAVASLAGGVGATAAYIIQVAPRSFEECVLDEMKGRAQPMLRFASQACRQRFPDSPAPTSSATLPPADVVDAITPAQPKLKAVTDPDLIACLDQLSNASPDKSSLPSELESLENEPLPKVPDPPPLPFQLESDG